MQSRETEPKGRRQEGTRETPHDHVHGLYPTLCLTGRCRRATRQPNGGDDECYRWMMMMVVRDDFALLARRMPASADLAYCSLDACCACRRDPSVPLSLILATHYISQLAPTSACLTDRPPATTARPLFWWGRITSIVRNTPISPSSVCNTSDHGRWWRSWITLKKSWPVY